MRVKVVEEGFQKFGTGDGHERTVSAKLASRNGFSAPRESHPHKKKYQHLVSNRQISTVSFCFMDVPPPCLNASRKNAGPYPAWGRVQRRTSDCSSRPRRLHHPLRLHPPPRRIWATSHDASVAVGWAGCWRTSTAAAGGGEDSDSTRGRRS